MDEHHPNAAELIRPDASLLELGELVQRCRGCDLWRDASKAIFGEGPPHPLAVFVGEQPGDIEDRQGRPFVGPAGMLLRSCLGEADHPGRLGLADQHRQALQVDPEGQAPDPKHLRGVSDKEQRQYQRIKESAEKEGRYGGRAKEVAARTVMKEHKAKGHPKGK